MKKNTSTLSVIIEKLHREQSGKLNAKLPYWSDINGIQLPQTVSLQQASSQNCAEHKVRFLKSCLTNFNTMIDLTGGYGSDSWAFSFLFDKVFYFEQNADLCRLAGHNFPLLFAKAGRRNNIEVNNMTIDCNAIKNMSSLNPDCIFIDPARRNTTGGKVFKLEDCSPNVLELLPAIAEICPYLLLKLSPMVSIQLIHGTLPHVAPGYKIISTGLLGLGGEVKETLVFMGKEDAPLHDTPPQLFIDKCDAVDGYMDVSEKYDTVYTTSLEAKYLYEPDALLKKADAHAIVCSRCGARKISPDVHLYIGNERLDAGLNIHFKTFRIIESLPFSKETVKNLGKNYPQAEVTANALPLSSDELRTRLKVSDGPESVHIFAFSSPLGRYFIVGQRL